MDTVDAWKKCFAQWPEEMPRRGVLVTTFGEQIAFVGFMTSDVMLLLERHAPDTVGARMILVPFQNVAAIKLTDVLKTKSLRAMGLEGKLSAK